MFLRNSKLSYWLEQLKLQFHYATNSEEFKEINKNVLHNIMRTWKFYGSILWMGFNLF